MSRSYRYCRIDREGCVHCGCRRFEQEAVIDDRLAAAWELSPRERRWFDRREGHFCRDCRMSRRVRMLLWTIRRVRSGADLEILHLNETNALAPALERMGRVTPTVYRPDRPLGTRIGAFHNEDMLRLSFGDGRFDLAVHSETLEHLADYERALAEVGRVLKPGGLQVYTVPLLFSRKTRRRMRPGASGRLEPCLPPSHHGAGEFPVVWEFGGDFRRERDGAIEALYFDNYWRNRTVFAVVEAKAGRASV